MILYNCSKCHFKQWFHFSSPWAIGINTFPRERSGSVVECLTRDQGAGGSSLTGVTVLGPWARHIYPSLVLVQPRKTCPFITERLLIGRKESNQTNKSIHFQCLSLPIISNFLSLFAPWEIFNAFLSSADCFWKSTFLKNYFWNSIWVSNRLDPDQARHFVGPDLDPICLQMSSADGTSR